MAKTKKTKIPKRIGGVKLPKELRKTGEAILEKANSPAGREMLAAGLTMAAAAATAAVAKNRAAAKPEGAKADETAKPGVQDPHAVADALTNAAEQVLGRLFGKRV